MNWHQRELEAIFSELNASEQGLTDPEVRERLEQFGPNKLADEGKISKLQLLIHQFKSPLIYILLIAALVELAVMHKPTDAAVILAVVTINSQDR